MIVMRRPVTKKWQVMEMLPDKLSFLARLGVIYLSVHSWSIIRNESGQYIVLDPSESLEKSRVFLNDLDLAWWLENEATDRMYMNTLEFFSSVLTPDDSLIDENVANLLLKLVAVVNDVTNPSTPDD